MYAKFHHNILHSSRDRASFTFSEFGDQATPRPIKNVRSQPRGLDLVNINIYAKVYQNIPFSLRDKAIFTFSEFGKASTDDKCHFTIPWARSFEHQIVCKILSKYSKRFNS